MMQSTPRRPRALAAILILSAVVLGAIGGIVFDRLVILPRSGYAGEVSTPAESAPRAPAMNGRGMGVPTEGRVAGDRYLRYLAEELELSDEQSGRVEEILRDQQERVLEITRESRPRIRQVADETREAIREVLTPQQWERWQELRQRRDRRGGPGAARHGEHMRDPAHFDSLRMR
jgi:Spy/CpxP family protein refolding chaperone